MLGNISRRKEVKMAYKTPTVKDGFLLDDQTLGPSIPLDSPTWFAWLEAPTTTCFAYALLNRTEGYFDGRMTVRKERRQRGGVYWSVYRRQGHRLRKLYLGPSSALTQARLQQVAARLHARDGPSPTPTLSAHDRLIPLDLLSIDLCTC
jgi:hypothetical protein